MSSERRILVVYYSRTGFCEGLGRELAELLGADVEALVDTRDRSGPLGFLAAGRDAALGRDVPCEPLRHDVADYDLVVVGTPVWANTMCTAVHSFLIDNVAGGGEGSCRIRRAACYLSTRRSGIESTFRKMAELLPAPPVATAGFLEKSIRRGEHRAQLEAFADEIKAALEAS